MEWQTGNPPTYGFYLATWLRGYRRAPTVSELWYNDCINYWSYARGYMDGQLAIGNDAQITTVIAWMPIPEPYTE